MRMPAPWITVLIVATAACYQESPPVNPGAVGVWGSDQARLEVTDTSAALVIMAGDCYGSRADAMRSIPSDSFSVAGTYTQFIGAYPGFIQQAALIAGRAEGNHVIISVVLPDTGQVVAGPFTLELGVNPTVSQCLYP